MADITDQPNIGNHHLPKPGSHCHRSKTDGALLRRGMLY